MKRQCLAVLIVLSMLLGSAACGQKQTATALPAATEQEQSVAPTVAAAEPTATTQPELVPTATWQEQSATPTTAAAEPTATTQPDLESTAAAGDSVSTFEAAPCPFAVAQGAVPQGAKLECGFVIVPEDHAKPGGSTIRLAVVVLKSRRPDRRPDPVVLLSGGPGEKTVSNALAILQMLAATAPNRDIVVFDQRGVGLSEPALECPGWEQAQFDLLDEEDTVTSLRSVFDALMGCRDRLVSEGHQLSAYNTVQSAADVDAIRIALGYGRVNLYAGSYGSLLGQAVARDHPDGIRSMVMWSVWPLEVSFFVGASTVTTNAALRLLDACAADIACSSSYPDLKQVFFDVIDRLNAEPVAISVTNPLDGQSYDALLSGYGVFGNLVSFLYQTQMIPLLPQAIYDVYNDDYDLMAQLQGQILALTGALSRGMMYSVVCAEDLIGQTPQDLINSRQGLPPQFQFDLDPQVAIDYGVFGVCRNWPIEEAGAWVKEPLSSDVPTLILEGEFDPVTPSKYGRLVAEYLSNSFFFEFPGIGHNIILDHCARTIASAFLDDPARAPDTSCIAELGIEFMVSYEDPAALYSLPVFPSWSVEQAAGYVALKSPQDEITMYLLVLEGDDLREAAKAAWALVNPDAGFSPMVVERPCVGCAARDVEKFALIPYDTGSADEFVLGFGWLHEGMVYLEIWQTDPDAVEVNGSQWEIMVSGFSISALDE